MSHLARGPAHHGANDRRAVLTRSVLQPIKTPERQAVHATSQQCPGASPGRRNERITSPRLPARSTRGDHETRASQVVGQPALSLPHAVAADADSGRRREAI